MFRCTPESNRSQMYEKLAYRKKKVTSNLNDESVRNCSKKYMYIWIRCHLQEYNVEPYMWLTNYVLQLVSIIFDIKQLLTLWPGKNNKINVLVVVHSNKATPLGNTLGIVFNHLKMMVIENNKRQTFSWHFLKEYLTKERFNQKYMN